MEGIPGQSVVSGMLFIYLLTLGMDRWAGWMDGWNGMAFGILSVCRMRWRSFLGFTYHTLFV